MIPLRLTDRYGRQATDLRVSLTDRCDLRCSYCMPAEGLAWLPTAEILTDEEMGRVIRIAVTHLGVQDVRFTGGEPLLRRGLVGIVAEAAALAPRPRLSMTTNGIGLAKLAEPLARAGLDRINVSLDTLSPERFARITRRDRLSDVLAGLEAAAAAGLAPVKINTVLLRGINDDEAVTLLRFALRHGYELRFIEQMPLDAGHTWSRERMVTADEILAQLEREFELLPDPAERAGAPAETFLVLDSTASDSTASAATACCGTIDGTVARGATTTHESAIHDSGPDTVGTATAPHAVPSRATGRADGFRSAPRVGIIASVTRPFCGACDRTRLTADGQIRNCLFAREESDLRTALRGGASDEEIAERWRVATLGKAAGHGIDDPSFLQPSRSMSAIGG